MAPTICEDDYESNIYRHKRSARYHSVISYAKGRQTQESSDKERPSGTVLRSLILDSPKYPNELNIKLEEENDDSVDSTSSSHLMSFHNYAKRRRPNNNEKNRMRSLSVSSASNESSVLSMSSTSADTQVSSAMECPLAEPQISSSTEPIASTTEMMSLYRQRFAKTPQTCQQRNLFEIAMKTIVLLRRNRLLQQRLQQFQMETRHFVDSVMSNPENAKLRQSLSEIKDKDSDARVVAARN